MFPYWCCFVLSNGKWPCFHLYSFIPPIHLVSPCFPLFTFVSPNFPQVPLENIQYVSVFPQTFPKFHWKTYPMFRYFRLVRCQWKIFHVWTYQWNIRQHRGLRPRIFVVSIKTIGKHISWNRWNIGEYCLYSIGFAGIAGLGALPPYNNIG